MSDRFGAITAYAIDETGLLCGEVVLWYSEVPTLLIIVSSMNPFRHSNLGSRSHVGCCNDAGYNLPTKPVQGLVSKARFVRKPNSEICYLLPCRALLQGFVICLSLNETASTIIAFVAVHQQILLSVPGTLESLSLRKSSRTGKSVSSDGSSLYADMYALMHAIQQPKFGLLQAIWPILLYSG